MNVIQQKSEDRYISVERCGTRALIRLIRPERKNALSVAVLTELETIFRALDADAEIETIVITGTDDAFASGANLNEIKSLGKQDAPRFALRGQNLLQRIYNSKKMTIAAVNGYCMGGGLDLALSCKRRVASPDAVFAHPGVSLGIMTGWGGTQLLPRLIGEALALELLFTAKRIGSREALRIGLIDEIYFNNFEEVIK